MKQAHGLTQSVKQMYVYKPPMAQIDGTTKCLRECRKGHSEGNIKRKRERQWLPVMVTCNGKHGEWWYLT